MVKFQVKAIMVKRRTQRVLPDDDDDDKGEKDLTYRNY